MPGLPGVGFKLTDDGNYDINGKRLTNVSQPVDDNDAANKKYLESENSKKADITYVDSEISKVKVSSSPNYHLQQSFTFYKYFGDQAELAKSNISIDGHKDHLDLLEIPRQGVEDGFAYSNIKLTNNLDLGTYSILFEIFGYNGSNIVTDGDNDRLLLFNIEGDPGIPDFDHQWYSNYAKEYIIFNNIKKDVNTVLCKSNANDNRRISQISRYLTRFYLKRYIQRYIVRAIVLFLGEISFPLCDISFQLCDISFPLRDISFLLCDISF